MSPSIAYLLKMVLVSGVLYAYYHTVLRDNRFHAWNRFYLLAAVLLSITVPLFHIPVQTTEDTDNRLLFQVWAMLGKDNSHAVTLQSTGSVSWLTLIGYGYAAAVLTQFAILGIRLLKLRKLRTHSPSAHVDGITLVTTENAGTPFSFFRWIFWNRALSLNSEEGRRVFAHELTHVRQGHSLDKIFLQITCIVFFPIVFFYLIRKELQLIHEYLADKQATRNEDTEAYARLLLSQAFQASPYVFANSFFQHPLKRRIIMMTRFSNPRFTYLRKVMFLPLALVLFGLLAFRVEKTHPIQIVRLIGVADKIQGVLSQSVVAPKDVVFAKPAVTKPADGGADGEAAGKFATVPASQRVTTVALGVKHDTLPEVTVVGYQAPAKEVVVVGRPVTLTYAMRDTAVRGLALSSTTDSILYVIDGKVIDDKNVLASINPDNIEAISVLKDKTAIAKYGSRAAHGVVEITLKDANVGPAEPNDDNKVFTKVEIEAKFPGGDRAWNDFVRRKITSNMGALQAAGQTGTCELTFIVNKDGTVTGVQALTMQGSVLADIMIDAITKGPRWIPAQQNGRPVKAFRRQKVTFQMPQQ